MGKAPPNNSLGEPKREVPKIKRDLGKNAEKDKQDESRKKDFI